jgi:hypothetical protein
VKAILKIWAIVLTILLINAFALTILNNDTRTLIQTQYNNQPRTIIEPGDQIQISGDIVELIFSLPTSASAEVRSSNGSSFTIPLVSDYVYYADNETLQIFRHGYWNDIDKTTMSLRGDGYARILEGHFYTKFVKGSNQLTFTLLIPITLIATFISLIFLIQSVLGLKQLKRIIAKIRKTKLKHEPLTQY